MLRALHLLLVLCLAFQAAAFSGTVRVCRYTGRVMAPCACPPESQTQPGVSKQACCELHKAEVPASPADVRAAASTPDMQLAGVGLMPEPAEPLLRWHRQAEPSARQQAPPSTPLYLSIRSLLI